MHECTWLLFIIVKPISNFSKQITTLVEPMHNQTNCPRWTANNNILLLSAPDLFTSQHLLVCLCWCNITRNISFCNQLSSACCFLCSLLCVFLSPARFCACMGIFHTMLEEQGIEVLSLTHHYTAQICVKALKRCLLSAAAHIKWDLYWSIMVRGELSWVRRFTNEYKKGESECSTLAKSSELSLKKK